MISNDHNLTNDPGWRPALRGVLWILIPGLAIRRQRKLMSEGGDGLIALRLVFVTFASALIVIGVVVAVLAAAGGEDADVHVGWAIAAVMAFGVVSLTMVRFFRARLDCASRETLSLSYRTRFFLRIAFSDAAAVMGFVGFILTWNPAPYAVGLVFAAVGFAYLAPTRANLSREQTALTLAGCGRNLVADLRGGVTA
jgi:hypothetical protein